MEWLHRVDIRTVVASYDGTPKSVREVADRTRRKLLAAELLGDDEGAEILDELKDASEQYDAEALDAALDHLYDYADARAIWLGPENP